LTTHDKTVHLKCGRAFAKNGDLQTRSAVRRAFSAARRTRATATS
jgi:hypothetical protein